MSSELADQLSDRPLLTLCQTQHLQVLDLLEQFLALADDPSLREARLDVVQQLRQRLSRHVQLMRHGFYPPLRKLVQDNSTLNQKVTEFEDASAAIVPVATDFLHQAERSPELTYHQEAGQLYQKLRSHFETEQNQLHPLFARYVPLKKEQKQLDFFRKRLEMTVAQDPSSPTTVPPRRPTAEELDRQAITRPVRPGENIFNLPTEV